MYFSSEGCTQGDPLGPFLFTIGYFTIGSCSRCRRCTPAPPSSALLYLDDTCYIDVPAEGLAALRDDEVVSEKGCGVRSNRVKQEVFGGAVADLSGMPVELRGAPGALPDLPRGYAGGKLKYIPSCSARW